MTTTDPWLGRREDVFLNAVEDRLWTLRFLSSEVWPPLSPSFGAKEEEARMSGQEHLDYSRVSLGLFESDS